jgi:hypothetical protein
MASDSEQNNPSDAGVFEQADDERDNRRSTNKALSADEIRIEDKLSGIGVERVVFSDEHLRIGHKSRLFLRAQAAVHRNDFPTLLRQLDWRHIEHPHYSGYFVPDLGAVEIALHWHGTSQFSAKMALLKSAETSQSDCQHARDDSWLPAGPTGLMALSRSNWGRSQPKYKK